MARKPANGNPALPKAKWKILLVGEYPSSQKVRAAILEKQGYVVDTVRDADEARARCQPNLYDLVLVDVERNPRASIKFCQEIVKVVLGSKWPFWSAITLLPLRFPPSLSFRSMRIPSTLWIGSEGCSEKLHRRE